MFVLVLAAVLIESAVGIPLPQLTEQQFRARARSLDNEIPNNVLMISGYSQVRRQGGRAFEDPIKFPTLTVKNPNQLYLDTPSKVKVSLADPVFDEKELETIAQKLEEINQLEGQRIREEQLQEQMEVEQEVPASQEDILQQPEEEYFETVIEEEPTNEQAGDIVVAEDVEEPEIVEESEEPVMIEVEVEEADADATESSLQSFELNYEEQAEAFDYSVDNIAADIEAVEELSEDLQEVPEDSFVEEQPIVDDVVVEDDGLVVEETAPEVEDLVDDAAPAEEDEVVEGSGANSLVEDMSLDVGETEEFIIEEVTSTLPPIDFGDIQEI